MATQNVRSDGSQVTVIQGTFTGEGSGRHVDGPSSIHFGPPPPKPPRPGTPPPPFRVGSGFDIANSRALGIQIVPVNMDTYRYFTQLVRAFSARNFSRAA